MNPLNTNSVKKLVLKHTLKTHYSVSALIDLIVKQVKEIPDYLKLKQDIEFILLKRTGHGWWSGCCVRTTP